MSLESPEPSSITAAHTPAPFPFPGRRSSRDGMRLRSLAAMARALGRPADLDAMIEIAAREALRALGAASVSVSRLEVGVGRIRTLLNVGDLGPDEEERPADETYRLCDFRQLRTVVGDLAPWTVAADDPAADPAEVALLHELAKGSAMAAPMVVDGVLWGELYATRHVGDRPFAPADLDYVETLAAILSGGISRARREETLERLVYRDALTGLANRRAMDETLLRADETPSSAAGRLCMVVVDVNGLKRVNDTFGHDEGDRVLTEVASLLLASFGDLHGSLVARVGGDEFAVIVPDQSLERVRGVAQAMAAAADGLPHGTGLACGITGAVLGLTGPTAVEIYRAADAAQYEAKRSGARTSVAVAACGAPGEDPAAGTG